MQIKIVSKPGYAEEGQPNPIRWMLLSRNQDGTYQNESAWIKCKDFFNDLAYTIQTGKAFTIYGFNAGTMKPSQKGENVYMLLDVLTDTFIDNLTVINQWLVDEQKMPAITHEKQDDGKLFIVFHPVYFENTYNISLISLIIRLCNYDDGVFKSFKDLEKYKGFPHGDQWKWDVAVTKGMYFNIPSDLKKFVWWQGKGHNNLVTQSQNVASLVHNNGVVAWTNAIDGKVGQW